jgi:hypothetical protein
VQELPPARTLTSRRGAQARAGKQTADTGWRGLETKLREFAADPAMPAARVLSCEPQHKLADLS